MECLYPGLAEDFRLNDSPTNEQHKNWRSLCSLEPRPSPAGRGRIIVRRFETSEDKIGFEKGAV